MNRKLRIAVADDEPVMCEYLEKTLPVLGHEVVGVARSGRELVDLCEHTQPDLIITDIKMPGLDGLEASMEIGRKKPTPIIVISAYHDPELLKRAEADHVMAYLVKPIGQASLQPAIAVAVRRFAELQLLRQETADLRQTLADRRVIEQAKGVLMKVVPGLDERGAFRRMQELASEKNQKLIDAAQAVLALEKTLRPPEHA